MANLFRAASSFLNDMDSMTKDTLEDQEVVKRAGDARRARRERRTASRDGGDGKAGGAGDDAFEPGDAALPEEPDEAEPDETTPPEVHGGIAHLSRILRSPEKKEERFSCETRAPTPSNQPPKRQITP
jgi:hypothetical protein